MSSWVSPLNLESVSITTVRAGMLMPRASVSVANTTFDKPAAKQLLHGLLEGGTIPA